MAEFALVMLGCAVLAFGPALSLFFLVIYPKAQLVIVMTSAAFFFLLGSVAASFSLWVFDAIGLDGPLVVIIPSVFFQFIARCSFVALCNRVGQHDTNPTMHRVPSAERQADWLQAVWFRVALAAGVGFGGMHAILLFGTMLASQTTNNVGLLYYPQDSSPTMQSLVVWGIFALVFPSLDVGWMLLTFTGMQGRLMHPSGYSGVHGSSRQGMPIKRLPGNSWTVGHLLLLLCLGSHLVLSLFTSVYFEFGCSISVFAVGFAVFAMAHGSGICKTVFA